MKRLPLQAVSVGMIPLTLAGLSGCKHQAPGNVNFKGDIKLDLSQSQQDWTPYTPKHAPEGSPNILLILYDDTGLAFWSPYDVQTVFGICRRDL